MNINRLRDKIDHLCREVEDQSDKVIHGSLVKVQDAQLLLQSLKGRSEYDVLSARIHYCFQLLYYRSAEYIKALSFGNTALDLAAGASHTDQLILLSKIEKYLSFTYDVLGEHVKAIDYVNRSLNHAEDSGDLELIFDSLIALGSSYDYLKDYQGQLRALKRARSLAEEMGDSRWIALIHSNIAHSYTKLKQYDEALEAINFCREQSANEELNSRMIGYDCQAAEIYLAIGHLDESSRLFFQVLEKVKKIPCLRYENYAKYYLGIIFAQKKEFSKSIEMLHKALDFLKDNHLENFHIEVYWKLSESYKGLGDVENSIRYMTNYCAVLKQHSEERIQSHIDNIRSIYDLERALKETREEKEKNREYQSRIEQMSVQLVNTHEATIQSITSLIESRDSETGNHITRTRFLLKELLILLKKNHVYSDELSDEHIELMYRAAPLHDIGKISISDSILLKPDKLTAEEFNQMKKHAEFGYLAIKRAEEQIGENEFLKLAMEITYTHHERWDGTGYPRGLQKLEIPLGGRAMAVIDVYDALITKRSYKSPYSHSRAIQMISSECGKHFDPAICRVFVQNHEVFREIVYDLLDYEEEKESLLRQD